MKKVIINASTFVLLSILIIFVTYLCSRKTIIGTWKSIDLYDEYYYTFNKDRTCSFVTDVARQDCTFEYDDDTLNILYKGNDKPTTFHYYFEGNTLIIRDSIKKENKFVKK